MSEALAIKYRPKTWDDVTEQYSIKSILEHQLKTNTIQHAYLFCGSAGTGKTTCGRIFANEINKHKGTTIELDAASHNSVDDIREVIQQAKTKSIDSEYKIFLLDEVHALSNNAWQALLKILEEPPAKSIFIMCTTDPEKIPKTILSRVQRFNFQRISTSGIAFRLDYILAQESKVLKDLDWSPDEVLYIAKLADGGMRDAITLLDKCLAYSTNLTMDNVLEALGMSNYEVWINLISAFCKKNSLGVIEIIENMYSSGIDLKQFIKQFMMFILDVIKYLISGDLSYTQLPSIYTPSIDKLGATYLDDIYQLLDIIVTLNKDLKWESSPKTLIESTLLVEVIK